MRHRTAHRSITCLLVSALGLGCTTHYLVNQPLARWDPEDGSGLPQEVQRASPELVLSLAFSGGGTRAAAFAYGVLEELAATTVIIEGRERALIDEVDFLSGVSGGSFTATYFALHGRETFESFETRFLKRDVQSALLRKLFTPWNWFKLASRHYGRGDLAAEYYDAEIFDGATFGDVEHSPGPHVEVTATDLGAGAPFSFTQPQFNFICSDISQYPVAWAVAASSALPGLIAPLTLENFAGSCGFEPPEWVSRASSRKRGYDRAYANATALNSYLDGRRKYIRLVDGGVSDNLALRGPFEGEALAPPTRLERPEALEKVRNYVLISVNAATTPRPRWESESIIPDLRTVLWSSSGVQIRRYNAETLELVKSIARAWDKVGASWSPPMSVHFIGLDFVRVEDEAKRRYLNSLPTSLQLPDESVDRLRAAGRRLLRESPEFQAAIEQISHGTQAR